MRRQLFVDPKVQGALLLRVVAYWFLSLLILSMLLLDWRIVTNPGQPFYAHFQEMWYWYGPVAAIATLILLPLLLFDSVRLSNRFAGPLFRLRRELRKLSSGETARPIQFREGDFWHDFAGEFNALAERVEALTAQLHNADFAVESSPGKGDFAADADCCYPEQLGAGQRSEATPVPRAVIGPMG
jgi:hypothetical protein